MIKFFKTGQITMDQAIAGVQAVAERLINKRDAARIENTDLHQELSRTHVRMNFMLDWIKAARKEIELLDAAIENDRENRIRANDAVKEARTETQELQTERDEIVGLLDSYGWWADNPNMLERLKFALATCQEKSDDLSTMQMAQRAQRWSA